MVSLRAGIAVELHRDGVSPCIVSVVTLAAVRGPAQDADVALVERLPAVLDGDTVIEGEVGDDSPVGRVVVNSRAPWAMLSDPSRDDPLAE